MVKSEDEEVKKERLFFNIIGVHKAKYLHLSPITNLRIWLLGVPLSVEAQVDGLELIPSV